MKNLLKYPIKLKKEEGKTQKKLNNDIMKFYTHD